MADITMCKGEGCLNKEQCRRYTSSPSEYQSWFFESPIKDGQCEMYWGEQSQQQFDLLVQIMRGDEELGLYDDEESETMTPKEKAIELVDRFEHQYDLITSETIGIKGIDYETAKQCALIAVEEILNARPLDPNYVDWDDCGAVHQYWYEAQKEEALEFWNDVKSELQSL